TGSVLNDLVMIPAAYRTTGSGSFHQLSTYFSTFPHGTLHYRSMHHI
ncbi:hypothetical protein INT47_004850, partial [Mucor saturninus]